MSESLGTIKLTKNQLHPPQNRPVCLRCGSSHSQAKGKRFLNGGSLVTQSRLCMACHRQFTIKLQQPTHEPVQQPVKSSKHGRQSLTSAQASSVTAPESAVLRIASHRRLELDLPADSSLDGLIAFSTFAQRALRQVIAQFDSPAQAELEWQQLNPRLREYVQARQRLELAFALQWNNVFASPAVLTHPLSESRAEKNQQSKRSSRYSRESPQQTRPSRTKQSPTVATRSRDSSGESQTESPVPEEPDGAATTHKSGALEELEGLRGERTIWFRERLRLKQQLFALEAENSRLQGHWSTVRGHLERLKTGAASDQIPSLETNVGNRDTLSKPITSGSSSTKGVPTRVAPPILSRAESANLERLANSLMAHLMRLEGGRVRPRDLPHVTGERGPWRAIITHLLSLDRIVWEGDYVTVSPLERLRRNLRTPDKTL
jgi:hypothetical protein